MAERLPDLSAFGVRLRLMRVDVNSFLGDYPFRRVPGTSPEALLRAMDRVAIDEAWVSHLPSVFWHDPAEGNDWLYEITERHPRLLPVPAVHPGLPGWEVAVRQARSEAVPAVRCDPTYYGLDPQGSEMRALGAFCAIERMPLMSAVRLEDGRQRHPNDRAGELPPWAVRALIRSDPGLHLIVTHADRAFVEEVHFGSTPEESARIWWDICWIWGPPEDHLQILLRTLGVERFLFGTGQPLRIPEMSLAKLDLLDLTSDQRGAIESENVKQLVVIPSAAMGQSKGRSSAPSRSLS
jgi:predicted TIM-barrel fold metal-dependent hydrolase